MFNLQEKKFIYLIGGTFLIFVIIAFLIILPQYQSIKQINKQIVDLRTELEAKYERAKQFHRSQTHLSEAKKIADDLNKKILKKNQEINFITLLENKSDSLQLKQNLNLSTNYNKISENFYTLDLDITVIGTYPNILEYLDFLQKNTYFLTINQLTFSKGAPTSFNLSSLIKTTSTPITLGIKTSIY